MVSECQHGPTAPLGTCESDGCDWRAKFECPSCGEQLCLGHAQEHKTHGKAGATLAKASR